MGRLQTTNRNSANLALEAGKLRNIGIIAHIDAGKTTVSERILYFSGRIHRSGETHNGTATLDYLPEEKQRGITITAAAATCYWQGYQINLIDTPGHMDFTVEVQRSLRVLDGGVVVFDGVAGVESQTETVWRQADEYKVPRCCFINKLDRAGADFYQTVKMIETRLGAKPAVIQLPIGQEHHFRGLVDLVENQAVFYPTEDGKTPLSSSIPVELQPLAEQWRAKLLEQLSDFDDELLALVLENRPIETALIKKVLRQATLTGQVVPVLGGAALKNRGIQLLLDAIVDYLPAPQDKTSVQDAQQGADNQRLPSSLERFSGLVFNLNTDSHRVRLAFVRVYSGVLKVGSYIFNSRRERKEHVARLVRIHAGQYKAVTEAVAGDIVAIIGLKNSFTGDTLCDPQHPLILEQIQFPEPVLKLALETKTGEKDERARLGVALQRLTEEDPTFRVETDVENGQTLIAGMGELHLEVIVDRLKRDYQLSVYTGRPQVAYRATIARKVRATGKYIHQTGGSGQYGHVEIELAPLERGAGQEFVNKITGGIIPGEYIPAIEQGVRSSLADGAGTAIPLVDVRVTLLGGSFHIKDSSSEAFQAAARLAVREGLNQAGRLVLEPIMRVSVVTPTEFVGAVLGDFAARRGQIVSTEIVSPSRVVANVPLQEMFGYVESLRAFTQGRGSYVMTFGYYELLPTQLQAKLS